MMLHEDESSFLDYWQVLVKYRSLIGLINAGALVISTGVWFMMPIFYTSTARILPYEQDVSLRPLLSESSGNLNGLTTKLLGIKSSESLWVDILRSRSVGDAVITRFNLVQVFDVSTVSEARHILKKKVRIKKSRGGIISIRVEDRYPQMAAVLANAFVAELDQLNRKLVVTAGKRVRVFINKRLNQSKVELAKAEDSVKAFQQNNRASRLDDQSQAVFQTIGRIRDQLFLKDVELEALLTYSSPFNPKVELLKVQTVKLRERLNELVDGTIRIDSSVDLSLIPSVKIPGLDLDYARLARKVRILESLYELLTQRYEMARIQEAKDSPTVQVLDAGIVSDKASSSKKGQIVIFFTFGALIFSAFLAFFVDYIRREREIQFEQSAKKPSYY